MKRQRKSTSCSFSTDLISEILLRLPQKSVARFRCVSKLWLSVTIDSYFINLFETRSQLKHSLLICFKEDDDLVVSSIPQHTSKSQPTYTYRMKFPRDYRFSTDSVHGLICLQTSTDVIVWNPSTSKLLTLPKLTKRAGSITTYLGYDVVEGKHKVIAVDCHTTCRECLVITLGSGQESWRIVETNQKHINYYNDAFGQCINGVIYYLASPDPMYRHRWVIMRFDVRSEKFDSIQLPSGIHVDRVITYEGRLACVYVKDDTEKNGFTLLILDEENKWLSKDFLAPFRHYEHMKFQLKGFTCDGEFIYGPYPMHRYHHSMDALFFDPVKNSLRRVGVLGRGYIIHSYVPKLY